MVLGMVLVGFLAGACGSDGADGDSSLAELLGEDIPLFDSEPEQMQRLFDTEVERQELIVVCMGEAGFEYIPDDFADLGTVGLPDDLEWGTEAWVERYGLGVTTTAFTQAKVGPDLIGRAGPSELHPNSVGATEANDSIVAGLDASQRAAYKDALDGTADTEGCDQRAWTETESLFDQVSVQLPGELARLRDSTENDQKVIDAERALVGCLISEGLPFTTPAEFVADLHTELAGIDAQPDVLSEQDRALLAVLQQTEVIYAVAMKQCGHGPKERRDLLLAVSQQYQQRFITENRAILDDIVSSIG